MLTVAVKVSPRLRRHWSDLPVRNAATPAATVNLGAPVESPSFESDPAALT